MNRRTIILINILLVLICTVSLVAQNIDAQLQDLFQQKTEFKKDVYYRIQKFIEDNPESPSLANLYFYLAELSTEIDIDNPEKTVEYYMQVIEQDPTFLQKDIVLYNIGYYGFQKELNKRNDERLENLDLVINWPDYLRLDISQLDYVLYALKQIMVRHQNSEYYARTAYRLGVIYFEVALDARDPQQYFEKSIDYFDQVAQMEDPLKYLGLFQRGWTYFTSAQFDKAIIDFSTILKLINDDELEESKAFFEDDAIENIAFSLIEYDGTDYKQYSQAALQAKDLFKDFVSVEFGKQILFKAVDLKLKYNAPMQAADIYNSYLDLYPTAIEAPLIVDSIMTIYQNNPSRTRDKVSAQDLIIEEYKRLVKDYSYESEWFTANVENNISIQLEIIKEAFEFLEPKYFNTFADTKTEENFAIYKELADKFAQYDAIVENEMIITLDIRKLTMSQDLAENLKQPRLYLSSIDEINAFIVKHSGHPNNFEYNEMIFYDYEQIYTQLKPVVIEQAYVDTLYGITINKKDLDSLFIAATTGYERHLIEAAKTDQAANDKLIGVIYQRAELEYENDHFNEAFVDYEKLITLNIDDAIKKVANSRLAEISRQRGDFTNAEQYYREAAKYATDEEKQTLNNNILATKQAKAITFSDSANYAEAAAEYLDLAQELENEDIDESIGFIVKAIESYQKTENQQKAIDLYLDIASKRSDKIQILAAYINAWTISDSLADWNQSEQLRRQFINKYPDTNEAYKLRIQIISFYESDKFNDKEQAAIMYIALHDDADTIDIGEVSKASIFLNALRLYQELDMENKIIELSVKFNDIYPEHESANDLLIRVATIYKDNGETGKFEEIATTLYKKDPTIDLIVTVAVQGLKDIKTEIDSLFDAGQYELMTEKMDEFKITEEKFIEKGLDLPTDAIYEAFKYYNDYIDFHKSYNLTMANFAPEVLSQTPNQLIKVNTLTNWNKNLVKGDRRIPKLLEICGKIQEQTIELMKAGNDFDLNTQGKTEALYHVAEVYEVAADAVITQIQKFVDISNQLNNERMQQNAVLQQQSKNTILNAGNQHSLVFRKKAVQMYNTILGQFAKDDKYSDEWTLLTKNRLVELGLRSPKIKENIFTSSEWNLAISEVNEISSIQDSLWGSAQPITYLTVLDSAQIIPIISDKQVFLFNACKTEIKPELVTFEYVFNKPVDIFVNSVLLENEPELQEDFIRIENDLKSHYIVKTSKYFVEGINEVFFRFQPDTLNSVEIMFAAKIQLQFDKTKLEHARTTEEKVLVTDYSWLTHMGKHTFTEQVITDSTDSNVMADSTTVAIEIKEEREWIDASDANFQYYKNQMYGLEMTNATGIWYPQIDTTKVEDVTFKKEIYINDEVLNATAKFVAQNMCSIWINGEIVVDSEVIIIDEALKKVQAKTIDINALKPGLNTIIAEVQGDVEFKGFIFNLQYTIKKGQ